MHSSLTSAALGVALLCGSAVHAQEALKIAFIDPLSGPFANIGELMLTHTQMAVEQINAQGGVLGGKVQLLQFDSKLSAQESQSALQAAIDQGAKAVITGGSGSAVVTALVQSAARHNQRNPGKEILILNHSSIDPELTGKQCSFWHFQFDANTAMKMQAIAKYIQGQKDIQKVYLLNQDYAHGQQWAHYGKTLVGKARPDIQFVGEVLHPLARVKDFSPYLAKIKESGADSVITGNWSQDMTLLLKAAGDGGHDLRYFNHSAGAVPGTVLAVSQSKKGQLTWVAEWHPGQANVPAASAMAKAYEDRTGKPFLSPRMIYTPRMLAAAVNKAGNANMIDVAKALEDLSLETEIGTITMRGKDHQILMPQVVNTIAPVDGKAVTQGWEGTNYGFRTDAVIPGQDLALDNECQMKRPG